MFATFPNVTFSEMKI